MGQRQQRHRGPAGGAFAAAFEQRVEGAPVGVAGEQLVAVDEVAQRHGLASERVDHVPVVDDVAVAVGPRPAASQRRQRRGAEEQLEAVVVDPRGDLVADQPGGNGVEHAAQGEAAGRGDPHADGVAAVGPPRRQRPQGGALGVDARPAVAVAPGDDLVDEGAVAGEIVEVARAAQQQGVLQGALEMAVGTLDRAVLVRLAAVVARRRHGVVRAQRGVARRGVLALVRGEIAVGRGQAVRAVLAGRSAERPQGVLEALGQGGEALAAEHHVDVGEAGVGQPEVVQQVVERFAGDAHRQAAAVGEVGQAEPSRRVGLAEHQLAFRTVQRAPLAHATLQGAAHAAPESRMPAHQLVEDGDDAQVRSRLEHGHDLLVEDPRQRIRSSPAALPLPDGRRTRIALDPVRGGGAEPRLGGRRLGAVVLSKVHVKPRLVIGDVSARHRIPSMERRTP